LLVFRADEWLLKPKAWVMPTRQHLPRNAGPKRKSLTEKPKRKTNKQNSKTAQLFVEFLIGHPGRPPT
jgi:hypothetical protein